MKDLQSLGIPVTRDLPGISKNLNDRLYLWLVTTQKPGSHHRSFYIDSLDKLEVARKQWITEQTGPLSDYYLPQMIGYFKSNAIRNSKEFQGLDSTVQRTLKGDTKPNYEVISVSWSLALYDFKIASLMLA